MKDASILPFAGRLEASKPGLPTWMLVALPLASISTFHASWMPGLAWLMPVLLIPTMDLFSWGPRQHALHARIAPIRAAEYGIPIVRSASSGISQIVDARGTVTASAPCSEDVHLFAGTIQLRGPGSLPWDRWMAPTASSVSGVILAWLIGTSLLKHRPLDSTEPPSLT